MDILLLVVIIAVIAVVVLQLQARGVNSQLERQHDEMKARARALNDAQFSNLLKRHEENARTFDVEAVSSAIAAARATGAGWDAALVAGLPKLALAYIAGLRNEIIATIDRGATEQDAITSALQRFVEGHHEKT